MNSPVVASPDEMQRVAQVGPLKHLVAPTPLHLWRLHDWARTFPDAQVWLPPPVRRANSVKGQVLGDEPPSAWASDMDQMVFRGSAMLNEVYFLHRKTRTLIFGDFIQYYVPLPRRPLRNALMNWAGVLYGDAVPIDIRLSCAPNKAQARASLERLLSWDFEKVILAHGECVTHDAKAFVRRAFRWLGR